jgi:phosphohistidine swiveling domain-containing protein
VSGGVLILDPGAALQAGESRVGGKATGLARLAAAGVRVPMWVVLPAEVFERHLERAGLADRLARQLRELHVEHVEEAARELRRAVEETPAPVELAGALGAAFASPGPFAVRSSVVGEDSAARSFAGQFDTELCVSARGLPAAIRRCWASAFNARALAYQLRDGRSIAPPGIAVVVQEMIEGDVSGVLFTSNPVSGIPDEALIAAAWGLGEGIVAGLCNTDEYVWAHDGRELAATVADKDVQVVASPGGTGTREAPVPERRRRVRALAPHEVDALGRCGLEVAGAFSAPQDIEWTRRDGELYLLQARPITARPAATEAGRIVWDNSNIQESFCGVTTPLTFSFAARVYASVYEQTLRMLGVPTKMIAAYRPALRNTLGLVGGRVYYNINNWYRMLLVLPSFGRNKQDMEQMMGLESPVDFVESQVLSTREKLRRLPRLALTGARLALEFRRLDRSVNRYLSEFGETIRSIDRAALADASLDELLGVAERLQRDVIERSHVPIVNDIYVMTTCGHLRRLVERIVGEDAPAVAAGLLAAGEGIESTEPTRRLMEIAQIIRADPALRAALDCSPPAQALKRLGERSAVLRAALDSYLDRYGDRVMGELKLETVSLHQDPSFLVHVLRNFAAQDELDPGRPARDERARRDACERRVLGPLPLLRRRRLRRVLARTRKGIKARENLRFARTRLFGLYRDIYGGVGRRLHEASRLEDPRDVFYLTVEELEAYHEGRAVAANLAAVVNARKAEYAAHEREELPNRFETVGGVYHGRRVLPAPPNGRTDGRVLRGSGCCPGVVEARLRVVSSPQGDLSLNGKVLTAVRTDPGWTPLFPGAAGILIERGSALSHSAVLAREFGIPAVVGVPNLMKIVHDGERVRLDGASGLVERLEIG